MYLPSEFTIEWIIVIWFKYSFLCFSTFSDDVLFFNIVTKFDLTDLLKELSSLKIMHFTRCTVLLTNYK